MTLFAEVTQKLRQGELLQSFAAILVILILALAFSWPGAGAPNDAWYGVAQVRSVLFMLFAAGFGAFAGAARRGGLETLVAWWLLVLLGLPLEAFAYAASYPDVPVWWFVAQPLLDVGAYFGFGLMLGRPLRRLPALLPLVPLFVFAGLFGLSTTFALPLLNPLATAQLSWVHLVTTALLSAATLVFCSRSRLRDAD